MLNIVKVGFKNENLLVPIVLMDKKTRELYGLQQGDLAKIKRNDFKIVAIVHPQLKSVVKLHKDTPNQVTVNHVLSCLLRALEGYELEFIEKVEKPVEPTNRMRGIVDEYFDPEDHNGN